MNDLFDELVEDATEFSKDFTVAINMLPYAGILFIIMGIVIGWIYFTLFGSNFFFIIVGGLMAVLFVGIGSFVIKKYYDFKKKYTRFYEIVKESKKVKQVKR